MGWVDEERTTHEHQPVGVVLAHLPRLALLAPPGGGKSTLVKRLAVAYADPTRREQIDDKLPSQDWFPLFFRCRELRGLARGSFAELLDALSQREPVRQHALVFRAYVDRALLAGRVLLLVDGLDEISDPGDRAAFVCTVRAALQAYPGIATVVTSREAGFRHVASHLAPICTQAVVSPLNPDDVRRLSVAWHCEVVGDTEPVRVAAEHLAHTIVRNDRIKRLAANPLLLTTLLLVKRWVGSLPIRRAVLYGKAIEVLLMTWNTEGHEPIPEEEALPQLCYVASAMMFAGVERISRPRLSGLLREARATLPSALGYVKGSVEEFISRVEDRSSLLMMTGNDVEDGKLVEFFEFRHLTFQEFLTARALVEGWHPGRKSKDTIVSVLQPHLFDEKWREVIPLAALLGGKETEGLIKMLTKKAKALDQDDHPPIGANPLIWALGNCLADEAPARPATIRAALSELVRAGRVLKRVAFMPALVRGRYGEEFREEVRKAFVEPYWYDMTDAPLLQYVWWTTVEPGIGRAPRPFDMEDMGLLTRGAVKFMEMLNSSDMFVRCEGARALSNLCWGLFNRNRVSEFVAGLESIRRGMPALIAMVFSKDVRDQYCACLALTGIGVCRAWLPAAQPDILGRLFNLWKYGDKRVQDVAVRVLALLPLTKREPDHLCVSVSQADIEQLGQPQKKRWDWLDPEIACLVVAWYSHALSDQQIAQRARAILNQHSVGVEGRTLDELERVGEPAGARATR
jgi:hypothetical protein